MKKLTVAIIFIICVCAFSACVEQPVIDVINSPPEVSPDILESPIVNATLEPIVSEVPTKRTAVLIVRSVDVENYTFIAEEGYFIEPVAEDTFDFAYMFDYISESEPREYAFFPDATIYFRPSNATTDTIPVPLDGATEFAEKVADGFMVWQIQYGFRAIVSMTNIPFRDQEAYQLISFQISDDGSDITEITVIPARRTHYPAGSISFRSYDVPEESFSVVESVEYYLDKYNYEVGDMDWRAEATLEELLDWHRYDTQYVMLEFDNDGSVGSIYGLYQA